MHRIVPSCLLLLLLLGSAHAQEFDFVLVPLAPDRVPGAFGSEWVTDLAITNNSDTQVLVERDITVVCTCLPPPLPAHATAFVEDPVQSGVRGRLLFVEKNRVGDLAFTLRVRDVSRQGETWGTVIPVIPTDRLHGRRFGLVDIPMTPDFRATLRIYDANADTPPRVRVRVFALDPARDPVLASDADTFLAEIEPSFAMPAEGTTRLFPASAEVALWLDPQLTNAGRVRIEIEPLDGLQEYWAFVSITHNTTQHVTVITPN